MISILAIARKKTRCGLRVISGCFPPSKKAAPGRNSVHVRLARVRASLQHAYDTLLKLASPFPERLDGTGRRAQSLSAFVFIGPLEKASFYCRKSMICFRRAQRGGERGSRGERISCRWMIYTRPRNESINYL